MKKKFLILLLATLVVLKTSAQMKFEINASINNTLLPNSEYRIKDGDIIKLNFINLNRIDSAVVTGSTFYFQGEVPFPSVAMLNFGAGGEFLLIDSSTYNVSLAITEIASNKYSYSDTQVDTKSFFYTLWKYLVNQKRYLNGKKEELLQQISDSELKEERLDYESSLYVVEKELAALYFNKAKELPNSYEMAYLLPAAPDFSYERYFWYYDELSKEVKNSFYGKNLYKRLTANKLL